uniref:Structural protein n=1 Tax=Rice ragged stunt virus TaxID=42475 RepID=F4YTT7_RRSV|nr:structural protein [Rice ragged stunt virus]
MTEYTNLPVKWTNGIVISDERMMLDPLPSEVSAVLDAPINYSYRYNELRRTHSLKLFGVWSGYIPSHADKHLMIFQLLQQEKELTGDEIRLALRQMQGSIKLPINDKLLDSLDRYSLIFAWIAYAGCLDSAFWQQVCADPKCLVYNPDDNLKFSLMFSLARQYSATTRICSADGLRIPSQISPDLGQLAFDLVFNSSVRQTVWFHANDFPAFDFYTKDVGTMVTFHVNFLYNMTHCVPFKTKQSCAEYLIQKAHEAWSVYCGVLNDTIRHRLRLVEGVGIVTLDVDLQILAAVGWYLPLLVYTIRSVSGSDISEWLNVARRGVQDLNCSSMINGEGYVGVPEQFWTIHATSKARMWPRVKKYTCDLTDLYNGDLSSTVLGEGASETGTVKWFDVPLGPKVENFRVVGTRIGALSRANVIYNYEDPSDNCDLARAIGSFVPSLPTSGTRDTNSDLEDAKKMFDYRVSQNVYSICQKGKISSLVSRSIKNLRASLMNGELRVCKGSRLWALRAMLFSDKLRYKSDGQVIDPYESDRGKIIVRLNNSSLKMLSAFVTLIELAMAQSSGVEDNMLNGRGLSPLQVRSDREVSRVVIAGAINEPLVGCLRRMYPKLSVIGFGMDAVGENERLTVEGASQRNLACDMLISDIDQTFYSDFTKMCNVTVKHALAFSSWSDYVLMKVNYPSSHLLNEIKQALLSRGFSRIVLPVVMCGQNSFTSEVFVYIGRAGVGGHVDFKNNWFTKNDILMRRYRHMKAPLITIPQVVHSVVSKCVTKHDTELFANPGSIVALTVEYASAREVVSLISEVCSPVWTWRTGAGANKFVNIVGMPSKARAALTRRTDEHYYLKAFERNIVGTSFGMYKGIPRIDALNCVSWVTIFGAAMRECLYWIVDTLKVQYNEVISIGARNMTDIEFIKPSVKLTCYDEYYANPQDLATHYNVNYENKYFNWLSPTLVNDSVYVANFVIMAPTEGSESPSATEQLDRIDSVAGAMAKSSITRMTFVGNLYDSRFLADIALSSLPPEGLKVNDTRTTVQIGKYPPCAAVKPSAFLERMKKYKGVLSYHVYPLGYDRVLKTCADNLWIPDVAGSPMLAFCQGLSYAFYITKPAIPDEGIDQFMLDDMPDDGSGSVTPTQSPSPSPSPSAAANTEASTVVEPIDNSDVVSPTVPAQPSQTPVNPNQSTELQSVAKPGIVR